MLENLYHCLLVLLNVMCFKGKHLGDALVRKAKCAGPGQSFASTKSEVEEVTFLFWVVSFS